MKTLIRDKDIAPDAGIRTDKLSAVGQNNQFLTPVQKAALTEGHNADDMHWHRGAGAISAQFGRNGLVITGQFIEANGIPSNIAGIPLAEDGQLLSVAIALGAVVTGTDVHITVYADSTALTDVTIAVGQRKAFAKGLAIDFLGDSELRCKVTQGQATKPQIFVEFRWR